MRTVSQGVCLVALLATQPLLADEVTPHTFQREDVLGTSFRLTVLTESEDVAQRCEQRALDMIEALRAVFSTWDPASELSRLNATAWSERVDQPLSPDLGRLLRDALQWRQRTGGAFDPYLGALHDVWRRASESGREPTPDELAGLAAHDDAGVRLRRLRKGKRSFEVADCARDGRFDVDGIAKGYIIDRALQAIVDDTEGLEGVLLDLGGDLRVWGSGEPGMRAPWVIDVADPRDNADNAAPLARITLHDQAVASSGGYARQLQMGERRLPHIFDPRSGRPATEVLGATVVAPSASAADALATALCVLPPAEGIARAEAARAACAIVDAEGQVHTSAGWQALAAGVAPQPWPDDQRVEVSFRLVDSSGGRRFKRHFVAVWVEDASGQRVKLLALWAQRGELKYLRDLDAFWDEGWLGSGGEDSPNALRTWTRATRKPGAYTLAWDGTDDDGRLVPRGRYRIRIDINREHGPRGERHTEASLELDCGGEPSRAEALDQPELADVGARYGAARR